jgi:hypothetical protein
MAERETPAVDPSDPDAEAPEEPRPEVEEAILVLADLVSLDR